jgi:hypothetical protein
MAEDRKYRYALECSGESEEDIDRRFSKIDEIMASLKIGDKLYDNNCWGDVFEKVVVEILDVENGIVKLYEPGIKSYCEGCVCNYFKTIEEAYIG